MAANEDVLKIEAFDSLIFNNHNKSGCFTYCTGKICIELIANLTHSLLNRLSSDYVKSKTGKNFTQYIAFSVWNISNL